MARQSLALWIFHSTLEMLWISSFAPLLWLSKVWLVFSNSLYYIDNVESTRFFYSKKKSIGSSDSEIFFMVGFETVLNIEQTSLFCSHQNRYQNPSQPRWWVHSVFLTTKILYFGISMGRPTWQVQQVSTLVTLSRRLILSPKRVRLSCFELRTIPFGVCWQL